MLCLIFVFYQDLLYRAIYWFCFPLLALLMFGLKYMLVGLEQTLVDTAYSLTFLMLQLIVLWGYFSLKKKKAINLTGDYLGWGDILFLVAIAFYLAPGTYVVFYVFSLVLVLLYAVLGSFFTKKVQNPHIPLAGLQAALLVLLAVIDEISSKFMLYDDSWLFF